MTSRLLSLVAVPISFVGNLLFWAGSAGLLRSTMQFAGALDVGALVLTVIGVALLLAGIATVALGSLGAYIVGGIHLLFSLLLHVLPFDPLHGGFSPAFEVLNLVRGINMDVSDGMYYYFPTGIGALVGGIFVAAGLAADRRRSLVPPTPARVGSGLTAITGLGGLLLALMFGARAYVRQLVTLAGAAPLDVVLLYVGVVLLAAVVVAARWSSAGALVAGAVITVVALIGLAAPMTLIGAAGSSLELRRALEMAVPGGSLLLIGLLLLVAGLAVRVRARRLAGVPGIAGAVEADPPPPSGPASV